MGRQDDSVVDEIKGYKVRKSKVDKNCVFLESPMGANFTLDVDVMREIVRKLDEDDTYRGLVD